MNKKYLTISVGILVVAISLFSGFFWYTKISSNSENQVWATYTQRLDSGDVISMDYPTGLTPVYGPYYGPAGEETTATGTSKEAPAYVIHFYPRDNVKTLESILVTQVLPTAIDSEKNALVTQNKEGQVKQSQWHIGEWTAYESSIHSLNVSLDVFYFKINDRDLSVKISAPEMDIERIMSSIQWNNIHMSKFDSIQGWNWPSIKTGK